MVFSTYNFGKDGNESGLSNDGSHEVITSLEDKGVKVHISYGRLIKQNLIKGIDTSNYVKNIILIS